MKKPLVSTLLVALVLTSCSLARQSTTVPPDQVNTQIAIILTQNPPTQPPSGEIPVTVIPTLEFTNTVAPSNTPQATATAQPSPTLQPTETATPQPPTATPSPTNTSIATQASGDILSKLGTPTYQETFANGNFWPLGEDQFTNLTLSGNSLKLTGLTRSDGWRLTWPKAKDFYLEATFNSGTCSGTDRYGLVARVSELENANQAYLVSLDCEGSYALRKWDGKNMTNLLAWTASKDVHAGQNQENRIGLLAQGGTLSVYLNGLFQKSITDTTLAEGYMGVFVGANQTQNYTVTITQFAYWDQPGL